MVANVIRKTQVVGDSTAMGTRLAAQMPVDSGSLQQDGLSWAGRRVIDRSLSQDSASYLERASQETGE